MNSGSEPAKLFGKLKKRPFGKAQLRSLKESPRSGNDGDPISLLNDAPRSNKRIITSSELPANVRSRSDAAIYSLEGDQIISANPWDGRHEPPHTLSIGSKKKTRDPLGLNSVAVPSKPSVDIIFIHGLGGSSLRTWSWSEDISHFWPQWLAKEPRLSSGRIWTFGYAGSIGGVSNALNIHDFAKDLLFKMKMESSQGVSIGTLPIIFVVHSMGGLVAKKAFLSGRHNDEYVDLVSKVEAMIFLSTPHRGGNGANSLSLLLKVFGMSKEYIKELASDSTFIQSLNDDFTHVCKDLKLYSFYETQKTMTPTGLQYIVDKRSGVLNLPNEVSNPMAADHYTVCKFESIDDARFKDVKNVLIKLTDSHVGEETTAHRDVSAGLDKLASLLGINAAGFDENLYRLLSCANNDSCRWITGCDWFKSWLYDDDHEPHLLWISGLPGAGKSVLTAYIASMIREQWADDVCQYHAFDCSNKQSRSASYLFRSFAYQIARRVPTLQLELQRIVDTFGIPFSNMNANVLWERIFRGAIFHEAVDKKLYWIVDGLDEAEPEAVSLIFDCFKYVTSPVKIRILIVSRQSTDIAMRVAQLAQRKTTHHLSPADTYADIRQYVDDFISTAIPMEVAARRRLIERVLKKASGNFLWVRLATRDLQQNWYGERSIENILGGLPGEMAPHYHRMMQKIEDYPQHKKRMATVLLIWGAYSFRPLNLSELKSALGTEFPDLGSLEHIIKSVCGDFFQLRGKQLTLVHETARHYLIHSRRADFEALQAANAHEYMVRICLEYLSSSKDRLWRHVLHSAELERSRRPPPALVLTQEIRDNWPFLIYAATSWTYHLGLANASSRSLLDLVLKFFANDAFTWINTVALLGNMNILIKAAQYLRAYLYKYREIEAKDNPLSLEDDKFESLRRWATDLIRLVGKFGNNLVEQPSSVYKLIPPFCPVSSMLRRAAVQGQDTLSVVGMPMPDWDDCRARLSVGTNGSGSKLIATSEVFAALIPGDHSLVVWHAETCEEIRRLNHAEYVINAAVNKRGDIVCTAGRESIKIWDIGTGIELSVLRKHSDDRILAVGFGTGDTHVLVVYQDHLIVCQDWRTTSIVYQFYAVDSSDVDARNGLRAVSFSPDGIKLVAGSRNRPVGLWDLTVRSRTARCVTTEDVTNTEDDVFLQPEEIQWHPTSGSIYILYQNTTLIDWNLVYDEKIEYHMLRVKGMACSPCGNYLLTYEASGSVKVFVIPDSSRARTPDLHLIYHLEHPEPIRDIAFAPNGRRFYDLRGAICGVWEPEVLVPPDRPHQENDQRSLWDSNWAPVMQKATARSSSPPITAIACAPDDIGFATGYDDGRILIHNMDTGAKIRSLPGHTFGMAIIGLMWSSSGRWIASADDSGRILVRKVQMPANASQNMRLYKPSEIRITNVGINQLLFSPDDRYLLVSTFSADRMYDIQERRICRIRKNTSSRRLKWIAHPSNTQHLISIDAGEVHIFDWDGLTEITHNDGLRFNRTDNDSIPGHSEIAVANIEPFEGFEPTSSQPTTTPIACSVELNSLTQTNNKKFLILETVPQSGYARDRMKARRIELLRATDITPSVTAGELVLELSSPELTREVSRIVGSYKNRLVFFNHKNWLCTWELSTVAQRPKPHYFLPNDWISSQLPWLMALSEHGTLLFPRNGEVAIIKNGIKF